MPHRQAGHDPFHIGQPGHLTANLLAHIHMLQKPRHQLMPVDNALSIAKRRRPPFGEQAAASRRHRPVNRMQQTAPRLTGKRSCQFQRPAGRRVNFHMGGIDYCLQTAQRWHVANLRCFKIAEQRASRRQHRP